MTQVTKWNVGNFVQQLIEEEKKEIKIVWDSKSYYIVTWEE